MAFPHLFDPLVFGIELIFTVIAVVFCFLIHFKTKESYELTKHEGIKYFRDAFLFFGLSYVMRFLFSLVLLSRIAFDFILPRGMFAPFFILPLGYFSTIGIFYLIFSSIWKRFNNRILMILGHSVAIFLSVISFFTRSHLILLFFQSALLIIAVILSRIMHTVKKKISQTRVLYFLVALLWLINLWVIGRRKPFSFEIELFFQIVSLIVFILIYHKIFKFVK